MAKTQEPPSTGASVEGAPDPDLLAAVVLDTLVVVSPRSLTGTEVARACERDPNRAADLREIGAALETLMADGLAAHAQQGYRATRAAVRAAQLSF